MTRKSVIFSCSSGFLKKYFHRTFENIKSTTNRPSICVFSTIVEFIFVEHWIPRVINWHLYSATFSGNSSSVNKCWILVFIVFYYYPFALEPIGDERCIGRKKEYSFFENNKIHKKVYDFWSLDNYCPFYYLYRLVFTIA